MISKNSILQQLILSLPCQVKEELGKARAKVLTDCPDTKKLFLILEAYSSQQFDWLTSQVEIIENILCKIAKQEASVQLLYCDNPEGGCEVCTKNCRALPVLPLPNQSPDSHPEMVSAGSFFRESDTCFDLRLPLSSSGTSANKLSFLII